MTFPRTMLLLTRPVRFLKIVPKHDFLKNEQGAMGGPERQDSNIHGWGAFTTIDTTAATPGSSVHAATAWNSPGWSGAV